MDNQTKTSTIAIVGAPNAGKSTLLNYIIGAKISITSPKVQTTRNAICGIATHENTQLIFTDTPGVFTPKGKLEDAIVKVAWREMIGVEQLVLLIDAKRGICINTLAILTELSKRKKSLIIVINKIDIIKRSNILLIIDDLKTYSIVKEIFMISAKTGENIELLKEYLSNNAKPSPWLYSDEEITNLPSRFIACELVREQLFLNLEQEIPYNVTVECEMWEELKDRSIKMNLAIYVTKEGQKKIIIGKGGSLIKKIGQRARIGLEELFERKIHLYLFIKVRENWIDNPHMLPK